MVEWVQGRRERLISSSSSSLTHCSLFLSHAQQKCSRFCWNTIYEWFFPRGSFFLCSRSIQFNSMCAIWCAPVCIYFICIHSWKCAQTLTRRTSQETFARCLTAQRILHLIFVLDFMFHSFVHFFSFILNLCPLLPHSVFNLICNNTVWLARLVWKVDSIRLMSFCHLEIKITLFYSKNIQQTSVTINRIEKEYFFVLFVSFEEHEVASCHACQLNGIRMSLATKWFFLTSHKFSKIAEWQWIRIYRTNMQIL